MDAGFQRLWTHLYFDTSELESIVLQIQPPSNKQWQKAQLIMAIQNPNNSAVRIKLYLTPEEFNFLFQGKMHCDGSERK